MSDNEQRLIEELVEARVTLRLIALEINDLFEYNDLGNMTQSDANAHEALAFEAILHIMHQHGLVEVKRED